jgi:hypothetical protein
MNFKLFEQVALREDVPEQHLRAGVVATIVEFVPHPAGGEDGCVLEVFSAVGESIAIVDLPLSAIEPLNSNEVWAVRPFAPTA